MARSIAARNSGATRSAAAAISAAGTRLAASNAELVARVASLCAEYGRRPATAAEARQILSLPA